MAHPLSRIIDQLKREPSRTGSIVITMFGDAIVPRGGSVWLGTLLCSSRASTSMLALCAPANSRLAADVLADARKGSAATAFIVLPRRSRQTSPRRATFLLIRCRRRTGRFELLLIGNGEDRDASREALRNAGVFGSPLPGVWTPPSGVPVPDAGCWRYSPRSLCRGRQRASPAQRELAAAAHCGCLSEFMKTFSAACCDRALHGPVRCRRLHRPHPPTTITAAAVLRDPLLPESLLRLIGLVCPGGLRRDLSRAACAVGTIGSTAMEPMKRARCRRRLKTARSSVSLPCSAPRV